MPFSNAAVLAHDFLRLRCDYCGHDKLVAFSCKCRGFCPSCGARRMAQTAAHLVDQVIALVPVRQWGLALPIPLRLLLAAQPKLVTPVLQVVHRVITRYLRDQAELKADEADSGAVTLIQRFGSAANLNVHLHCLVLDGVYRCGTEGEPIFVEVPAPTARALHLVVAGKKRCGRAASGAAAAVPGRRGRAGRAAGAPAHQPRSRRLAVRPVPGPAVPPASPGRLRRRN